MTRIGRTGKNAALIVRTIFITTSLLAFSVLRGGAEHATLRFLFNNAREFPG